MLKAFLTSQWDYMLLSHLTPIILKKTHKHPYHAYTWKKSLVLHCLLLKWESHHLFGFYTSEIKFKNFQKILQIISLLFPVVNIEEWALIQPKNLLPRLMDLTTAFMQISTLIVCFFQTLIKIMLLQTTVMKILQLLAIGLLTN